jgi:hypothetical protein
MQIFLQEFYKIKNLSPLEERFNLYNVDLILIRNINYFLPPLPLPFPLQAIVLKLKLLRVQDSNLCLELMKLSRKPSPPTHNIVL